MHKLLESVLRIGNAIPDQTNPYAYFHADNDKTLLTSYQISRRFAAPESGTRCLIGAALYDSGLSEEELYDMVQGCQIETYVKLLDGIEGMPVPIPMSDQYIPAEPLRALLQGMTPEEVRLLSDAQRNADRGRPWGQCVASLRWLKRAEKPGE